MKVKKIGFCIAIVGMLAIILGIRNIIFLIIGVQSEILYFSCKNKKNIFLLQTTVLFAIVTFIVSNSITNFTFMPQAKALLDINSDIFYWFAQKHIHAIRLLVAYPGVVFSKYYDLSLNQGYSYYLIIIFSLTYIYISKSCAEDKEITIFFAFILSLIIIALALFMNGRIIFAFLGFSMIIYSTIRQIKYSEIIHFKDLIIVCIGILFTTVSSGCMMLGIVFIIGSLFAKLKRLKIHCSLVYKLCFSIALILLFPFIKEIVSYLIKMFNKNIVYFGGSVQGVIGLLQHGMGRIVLGGEYNIYIVLIVIIIILISNFYILNSIVFKKYNINAVLILAINISLYGLMVGFSTGSMIIIPITILGGRLLSNVKIQGY